MSLKCVETKCFFDMSLHEIKQVSTVLVLRLLGNPQLALQQLELQHFYLFPKFSLPQHMLQLGLDSVRTRDSLISFSVLVRLAVKHFSLLFY